jgi:hypothetical protein
MLRVSVRTKFYVFLYELATICTSIFLFSKEYKKDAKHRVSTLGVSHINYNKSFKYLIGKTSLRRKTCATQRERV